MGKKHNGTVYLAEYYLAYVDNKVKMCASVCDFRKNKFALDHVIDLFNYPPPMNFQEEVVRFAKENNFLLVVAEEPVQAFLTTPDNPDITVSFISYNDYVKNKFYRVGDKKKTPFGKSYFK